VQFLADESRDFRVVLAQRQAGHDVLAVVEDWPGAPDREVLESARTSGRILLTEDRDFGQLVFAGQPDRGGGVVFVRCPERARPRLPQSIASMVERLGPGLEGHFVMWTPGKVRSRRPERP
jgi:predicted nuclease of predicted toxin-antitoxin system